MKRIKVNLWSVADAARRQLAALEAIYSEWRKQPKRDPKKLDAWIEKLGEARWRAERAFADAKNGSRWADRHKAAGGK